MADTATNALGLLEAAELRPRKIRLLPLWTALLLFAAALVLRFAMLGQWPYDGDETATLAEAHSLFGEGSAAHDSQEYRLPRAIPLGYALIRLSIRLFGESEFGSRVLEAVAGALLVPAAFLLLRMVFPYRMALIMGVLIAIWPDHIYVSQETRFYSFALLFSWLAVFLGAVTVKRQQLGYAVLTCLSLVAAVLSHSLALVLFFIVFAAVQAGLRLESKADRRIAGIFAATGILLAAFLFLYLRPLLAGWNGAEGWSYSPLHAVLAGIGSIGWPFALLALFGFGAMVLRTTSINRYWTIVIVSSAAAIVGLPLVVVYSPDYSNLFLAGPWVGVAYAIAEIGSVLMPVSSVLAGVWFAVSIGFNLPSLASYYMDGSRHDLRSAAAFVRSQWQAGDAVAGFSMGIVGHYDKALEPRYSIRNDLNGSTRLQSLHSAGGRIWIIAESGRGGLDPDLQRWLYAHAEHKARIQRRRFDQNDFITDVYLLPAATLPPAAASGLR